MCGRKLIPEQQNDWEKKLKQYAYIVNITCDVLTGIDKIVTEKLSGKAKALLDSAVRAVYAGLSKLHSMLQSGYQQAQSGIKPDFSELPFPDPLPPLPSKADHFISWFQLAWKHVDDAMKIVAVGNSEIAELLPPIEAAGNELVKDLQEHFPSKNAESPKPKSG